MVRWSDLSLEKRRHLLDRRARLWAKETARGFRRYDIRYRIGKLRKIGRVQSYLALTEAQ